MKNLSRFMLLSMPTQWFNQDNVLDAQELSQLDNLQLK